MTKSQIKAELRRSACEDEVPWDGISYDVFCVAVKFLEPHEWKSELWADVTTEQTFFLLVAEAL